MSRAQNRPIRSQHGHSGLISYRLWIVNICEEQACPSVITRVLCSVSPLSRAPPLRSRSSCTALSRGRAPGFRRTGGSSGGGGSSVSPERLRGARQTAGSSPASLGPGFLHAEIPEHQSDPSPCEPVRRSPLCAVFFPVCVVWWSAPAARSTAAFSRYRAAQFSSQTRAQRGPAGTCRDPSESVDQNQGHDPECQQAVCCFY